MFNFLLHGVQNYAILIIEHRSENMFVTVIDLFDRLVAMELFALLIGLFLLVTVFMPWINHSRFGSVKDDIKRLQEEVRHLRSQLLDQGEKVAGLLSGSYGCLRPVMRLCL